jgi:RNA polymerase sigma-70 factor (ECF subfamily)
MNFLYRQPHIALENLSDEELIRQFRINGDQTYFVTLFQRYTHLIYGVCKKYLKQEPLAEDAVMEIYEKLLREIGRHDIQLFKAWLYQVSKNHCLMHLRRHAAHPVDLVEEVKVNGSLFMETEQSLHLDEQQKALLEKQLQDALEQLNADQKKCIELFYLLDKSYLEICKETGFNLKQVKSFIQNGKRNLKIQLSKEK